jgi:hypothetical protein
MDDWAVGEADEALHRLGCGTWVCGHCGALVTGKRVERGPVSPGVGGGWSRGPDRLTVNLPCGHDALAIQLLFADDVAVLRPWRWLIGSVERHADRIDEARREMADGS